LALGIAEQIMETLLLERIVDKLKTLPQPSLLEILKYVDYLSERDLKNLCYLLLEFYLETPLILKQLMKNCMVLKQ
jgi:hypothetical protein